MSEFEVSTDARWLGRSGANPDCGLGVMPINFTALLAGTDFDPCEGRADAAFAAGNNFEKACSGVNNSFAPLLAALAEEGLDAGLGGVEILPAGLSDEVLSRRTRRRIAAMCAGDRSVVLLTQAVFGFEFAGRTTYIRPDAVALIPHGGRLFVVEMKGFRIRDGHYPSDKLATALEQTAVYQIALRRILVSLGLDPALVSDTAVVVCAANLGMTPKATLHDNTHKVATLELRIDRAEARLVASPNPAGLLAGLGANSVPADRLAAFQALVAAYGVAYKPSCMTNCPAALACRADAADEPSRLGTLRLLTPVGSLHAAGRLSHGESPADPDLTAVAERLVASRALLTEARTDTGLAIPAPPRRRRPAPPAAGNAAGVA